jgi:DNA-binding response OmpR family regulator
MNRVLIVDDEPDMGSLVAQCLDPLGIEVVQASGLSSARSVAQRAVVDVVLLDLALGAEDGLEILEELRGSPGLSNAPVVVFSAHDSRRAEALERGVDEFLARPFAFRDLQSMVARHLKRD